MYFYRITGYRESLTKLVRELEAGEDIEIVPYFLSLIGYNTYMVTTGK